MKNTLYTVFAIALLFFSYSCENEDEARASANKKYLSNSKWVAVQGSDSIRLELYDYGARVYIHDTSTGRLMSNDYYYSWSVNSESSMTLHYKDNNKPDSRDRKLQYTLKNKELAISDLINGETIVFNREYTVESEVNADYIAGSWHTTLSQDYILLVFENETMKEYVYEKNTGDVLKYTDYHYYSLYKRIYTYGNKERIEYIVNARDNSDKTRIIRCFLDNNKLTIFENGNPVIYNKIEE